MQGHDIVVIGGSAGSVETVTELARHLPVDFPAAVLVVIHFPEGSVSVLPRILARAGALDARHVEDGDPVRPGRIYVAAPGCHLMVCDGSVCLSRGPKEKRHRPAIDPLFRSAAHVYGPRVIGLVLSGNLNDGTAGLLAIKQHGGIAVVQDPETALYSGMPHSAVKHVAVDHIVPSEALPGLLLDLTRRPAGSRPVGEVFPVTVPASGSSEQQVLDVDRHTQPGQPSSSAATTSPPTRRSRAWTCWPAATC